MLGRVCKLQSLNKPYRMLITYLQKMCQSQKFIMSAKHSKTNISQKPTCLAEDQSSVIEASYITVHSYDILVINTRPRLRLGLV